MEQASHTLVELAGAACVSDPRIDEPRGLLDRARTKTLSLILKVYDLEKVCDSVRLEHEELLQKLLTKAKLSKERTSADCDGALSRYHGILRSIWVIVKEAEERDAGHADKLTQLRLLFKAIRKTEVILFPAGTP